MRLTRARTYAVHTLAHLAAEGNGRTVTSLAIAEARGIPHLALLKVLHALVAARLLRSDRGMRGGNRLARPAPRVTLLEILEAVDGPLDNHGGAGPPSVHPAFDGRLEEARVRAAGVARRELARVRLSDLAGGRGAR
jgi:Rrf2 family protein